MTAAATAATGPGPRRSGGRRWLLIGFAALALLLTAAVLGGAVLVARNDLGGFAAGRATAALGRTVSIGSLRITPGRWTAIELRDASLANLPGGTEPSMAKLGRVSLELDLLSLLSGPVATRGVTVEGFTLLLERLADRTPNWRFGPPHAAGVAPADRRWIPALPVVTLRDSAIVFRTTGGQALRIRIDSLDLAAPAAASPVTLRLAGAYNGAAVTMDGTLGSLGVLRDARQPYPALVSLRSGDTTLGFDGTMTDPLNADGAVGRLTLEAPSLGPLLAIAGVTAPLHAALTLAGAADRQGDVWRLRDATGTLDGSALTASLLQLTEGATGSPDAVAATLEVAKLDLNHMAGGGTARSAAPQADLPIALDAHQDPVVALQLRVRELVYAQMEARDVALQASIGPGRIALDALTLTYAGAAVTAKGLAESDAAGTAHVTAEAQLAPADLDTLRRAVGLHALPMRGRLEGRMAITAAGPTLNQAAARARVSAVLAMRGGEIANEVIEMGSTDIRLLFRQARGTTPVTCLLGVMDMRAGIGDLAPLRIRAGAGTLAGTARFDLNRRTLDLVIGSQSATTSDFALDIPVRVHGRFADPEIGVARWSAEGRARLAAADHVAALPPSLRSYAQQSPCYRAQGRQ